MDLLSLHKVSLKCLDGTMLQGFPRRELMQRRWVRVGDVVKIKVRDNNTEPAVILYVLSANEVRALKERS